MYLVHKLKRALRQGQKFWNGNIVPRFIDLDVEPTTLRL